MRYKPSGIPMRYLRFRNTSRRYKPPGIHIKFYTCQTTKSKLTCVKLTPLHMLTENATKIHMFYDHFESFKSTKLTFKINKLTVSTDQV